MKVAITLTLFSLPFLLAGCRVGPPRLVISEMTRQLGAVQAGESKEAVYPIRNDGQQPLLISGVEGGCGCVTPSYPSVLQPGESGEIRARFEPSVYWGGPMEKRIKVHSNDPVQPEARLLLSVNVIPYVAVDPPSPVVVKYVPGETITRQIRLTPRKGSATTLGLPAVNSPLLRARLAPPTPGDPDRMQVLHLQIGPCPRVGDFNSRVELPTTEPRLPELPISVVGVAKEGPVVSPRAIKIAAVDGATPRELRTLDLFTRTGKLQVIGVNTGNPALKAEVRPRTPGRAYEVVVNYTGGWKPGPVSSSIRIRTSDPRSPEVVVPFEATVR